MRRNPIFSVILGLLIAPSVLFGQSVTSSALAGSIRSEAGTEPLSGVNIQLVHNPTGSSYGFVTDSSGRFRFTGLRPGGPYTINVRKQGYLSAREEGITLGLQQTATLNIRMKESDREGEEPVFELEAFEVIGEEQNLVFIESNQGTNTRIDAETIRSIPSVTRSLSDITRLDPRMAVYDRDSGQVSAGGRNTRYNSLLIDGVPTNDSFGISASGLPALKQPFALDSIAEISVQHSPYSVENAGFTGAAISARTKSGSNVLRGTVYGYFRNDSMVGDLYEVDSDIEIPFQDFTEYTLGASVGGPIIKDKLFYFVSFETVEESVVRDRASFEPDEDDINSIKYAAANFFTPFDIGEVRSPKEAVLTDDKLLVKLDWNVNSVHRVSARYNRTIGIDPRFPDPPNGGFDSRWYETEYTLEDITFEVFSNWTSDFSTELRVSLKNQGQVDNNASNLPLVGVQNVRADSLDRPGESFSTTMNFGTGEIDDLNVNTDIVHFKATWFRGAHEFKVGLQYEANDNRYLNIQYPFGSWRYESIEQFEEALGLDNRGTPLDPGNAAGLLMEAPAPDQTGAAEFKLTLLSAFIEDVWTFNERLTMNLGVRIDYPLVDQAPPEARPSLDDPPRSFEEVFGMSNQNTIDGNYVIQPRFGFNYALKKDRSMQLRGGVGLFYGTAPHVWLSTTYVDNGSSKLFYVTGGQQDSPPFSLDPQLVEQWLIDNAPQDQDPSAVNVNYLNPDFKMPTEWKSNLALDIDIKPFDAVLTLEGQWGWTEQDIHYINQNLKIKDGPPPFQGFLPDGRVLYDMNAVTVDPNLRYRERGYRQVIELTNTEKGESYQYTIQLDRTMRNHIAWRLGYTYSVNRTVTDGTSREAYDNWASNVGFDPNSDILGTSSFETRHRFVGSLSYELVWSKRHLTRFTLVYDGRVGRPFSFLGDLGSNGDMNGDGNDSNDLLYVPSGPDDPFVSWGNRNNNEEEREAFIAYVQATDGLKEYMGQVVPRNSGRSPWIDQWDLNITHEIKTWENHRLELILNIQNIGNLINDQWGLEKRPKGGYGKFVNTLTQSTHSPRNNIFVEGNEYGHYRYGFEDISDASLYRHPQGLSSRWAMQVGLRYSF